MKRFTIAMLVLALMLLAGASAQASLSWQTAPILGYGSSNATGDVVVITGAQPLDGGNPYYDVDNNVVMGPTIPHFSTSGDPLFGIGSPSVTVFDPGSPLVTLGGAAFHWWPGAQGLEINSGSGIYLDPGVTYHWKQVFDAPTGADIVWEGDYTGGSFVMLFGAGVTNDQIESGLWTYTETWTKTSPGTPDFLTSGTMEFSVVPEPATMLVWGLLGMVVVGYRVWRRR